MNSDTPTPRTDAAWRAYNEQERANAYEEARGGKSFVSGAPDGWTTARTLERELAEAKLQVQLLTQGFETSHGIKLREELAEAKRQADMLQKYLNEATQDRDRLRSELMIASKIDMERVAQLLAHRACGNQEHDQQNGKLAGYCVVCQTPWPCRVAKSEPEPARDCWREMARELAAQLDICHIAYRNYYAGAIFRHEWEGKVETMWKVLTRFNAMNKEQP